MKVGGEKPFSFCSCCKESEPCFVFGVGDSLLGDPAVDEPISDLIFCLLGGAKSFNHFFSCPMFRKMWRRWIGTVGESLDSNPWGLSRKGSRHKCTYTCRRCW